MNRIKNYLSMRDAMPMPQLGDGIHYVNVGTEWEGELRLSDLRNLVNSHDKLVESLRAIAESNPYKSVGIIARRALEGLE